MNFKNKINDRRKHRRRRVKQVAYVITQPTDMNSGAILDISLGGLLFEYFPIGNTHKKCFDDSVLIGNSKYHLSDIASKTIDDFACMELPLSSLKRKRRIHFNALSASQHFLLRCYIYEVS